METDFNVIEAHQILPRQQDETLTEWVDRWLEYRERMEPESEHARRLR